MASYIIFWAKDRVENYLKNGDKGPLSVIFGGPHQSQPRLGKITIEDKIYPITVIKGKMYILGCMEVDRIINEKEYTEEILFKKHPEIIELYNKEYKMWDSYCANNKNTITHIIPWNCMDNAAIGKNGAKIIKRELPESKICLIKLGNEESPLKMKDGKILTSNLIGYFRKLNEESEKIFLEIIKNINE
jgi:hypothetical protein